MRECLALRRLNHEELENQDVCDFKTEKKKYTTGTYYTSRYYMGNKIIINYWLLNGGLLYYITFSLC